MVLNDATDLRLGTTGVSKVYLGSTLVWSRGDEPVITENSATMVTSLSDIDTASTYMLALSYNGTDYYLTDTKTEVTNHYHNLGTGITISSNSIDDLPSDAFLFNLRNGYKMVSGSTYMKVHALSLTECDSESDAAVFDVVSSIRGYSLSYGFTLYGTYYPYYHDGKFYWNFVDLDNDLEKMIFRLYKLN